MRKIEACLQPSWQKYTRFMSELQLLHKCSRRTVNVEKFKQYVTHKLQLNKKIMKFYEERIHRKMKLNRFYNTRRSEQRMINNFKKKFGDPKKDNVIIGMGDWLEGGSHRKFKEPTKGKGFRDLFRRHGFKVYLVDEFKTSVQCFHCKAEDAKCEKFLYRKDPNTSKAESERHYRLVHGLLMCKTSCNRPCIVNRDFQGSSNIQYIAEEAIRGRPRPEYLSRENLPVVLNDTTNHKPLTTHTTCCESLKIINM